MIIKNTLTKSNTLLLGLILLSVLTVIVPNPFVYGENIPDIETPADCNTVETCNGESCDSKNNCLENCNNLTQVYDEATEKCLNLIGENCKLNEDCVSKSICSPEWNVKEGLFEGKCRCSLGYFEHPTNRICEKRRHYGQECDDLTSPCETSLFLTCKEGICQCENNITQIYDPIKKTCAIRTGTDCYNYRSLPWYVPCVQNAECKYFFKKRNPVKCKCAPGYIETKDGFCMASFGHNCNSTSVCHSTGKLVCSDGKCQCDSPMYQVFDKISSKCSSVVGTHCDATEECISTADCDESDSKCKCRSSYTETNNHLCELTVDQKCDISKFQCNSDKGLTCKNGLCKCFDSSLEFDIDLGYCKVKDHGSRCGIFTNQATHQRRFHARCDSTMSCIKKMSSEKEELCICQILDAESKISMKQNVLCHS